MEHEKTGLQILPDGMVLVDNDMIMTRDEYIKTYDIKNAGLLFSKRGGISREDKYWPNGKLSYELDESVFRYPQLKGNIEASMDEYKEKTCIQFERTSEGPRVDFVAGESRSNCDEACQKICNGSCNSYVGYVANSSYFPLEKQRLCLSRWCHNITYVLSLCLLLKFVIRNLF